MTTIPGVYTSMTGAPPQKTSLTIDTEMEGRHHHHMDELIKITALVIERPTPPRTTDIVTSTQPHIIIRSTQSSELVRPAQTTPYRKYLL